jgi:hypothetical protein
MRGYNCHEEIEVYRTTNCLCSQTSENGSAGRGGLPENRHLGSDVFNWKRKFSGLGTAESRRLRQLEEENARLKQTVADLTLDKQMLQDVLKKKL